MVWVNILIDVLLFFFVIICLLMGLVILMQRSKQEGLGAAFGGGFTDSVWGAQTSNVLVKTTVVLAILFFVLSLLLARLYAERASDLQANKASDSQTLQKLLPPVTPLPATPSSSAAPAAPTITPAVAPAVTPTNSNATPTPAAASAPNPEKK